MTDQSPSDTERWKFIVELPMGETPADDVACAWCGRYSTLFGPLSRNGELSGSGDMVCRPCAEKEDFDVDRYVSDTDRSEEADQSKDGDQR